MNDGVVGYTHNDTVNFYTPANIDRVNFPWREHHIGLTLTHTELKIDGISVTDEQGNGDTTEQHSQRDMHALVNLLADKLQDFGEQYARTMNSLLWGDGTTDAKALAGMQAIIVDNPQAWSAWRPGPRAERLVAQPCGDAANRHSRWTGTDRVLAYQRGCAAHVPAKRVSPAYPLRWPSQQGVCGQRFHLRDGD